MTGITHWPWRSLYMPVLIYPATVSHWWRTLLTRWWMQCWTSLWNWVARSRSPGHYPESPSSCLVCTEQRRSWLSPGRYSNCNQKITNMKDRKALQNNYMTYTCTCIFLIFYSYYPVLYLFNIHFMIGARIIESVTCVWPRSIYLSRG